jgi:hypothetical protein
MTTTKTTLIVLSIFALFSMKMEAQKYQLSNPLFPSVNSLAEQSIGGFLGIGPNWQGGTHFVECPECYFEDGTATGFTLGAIYQRKFATNFFYGGYLSFDIMNISSTYRETESIDLTAEQSFSGEATNVNIEFRHSADMNLTYFNIAPFVAYNPAGWLTLRAAPKLSIPIGSNITHTKTPTKSEITIDGVTGRSPIIERTIQDSKVTGLTSPLFGSDLTMMFNLTPAENSTFSIGYTQFVPFMETSSFGENFVISSWRAFIEFKYALIGAYDYLPKSTR